MVGERDERTFSGDDIAHKCFMYQVMLNRGNLKPEEDVRVAL